MLSTQQKAIIRRIAEEQIRSFIRISKHKLYEQLIAEFEEEGYDVKDIEVLEYFAGQVELWDKLLEEPDQFLTKLDELNLGMLKHILLQEFEINPDTRGIWKKLNLYDRVNLGTALQCRN